MIFSINNDFLKIKDFKSSFLKDFTLQASREMFLNISYIKMISLTEGHFKNSAFVAVAVLQGMKKCSLQRFVASQ